MDYKKYGLMTLIIFILLFSVTGCIGKIKGIEISSKENKEIHEGKEESRPEKGGELTLPLTTLSTLNPLVSENITYHYFSKLIFEGMFRLNEKFDIEKVLAKDYKIINNGKAIEVELRDDVYWHDGNKMTVEDVLFTIDVIKSADNENPYKKMFNSILDGDIRNILNARKINDYKLEVIFDKSYSNGLEILTFPIVPRHIFYEAGQEGYKNALKVENYKPIGTGPYKFKDYEKFKAIKLEVNEDWWGGRAYIDTVIGKILESEELMLTAFETDQVDVTISEDIGWDKYIENKRIDINEYISNSYEFLGFNFNNELFKDRKNNGVRKAISYGIDRQAILEEGYLNHASRADLPMNPDSWLASEHVNTYGYNLARAKEELEAAGWKDRAGDGILRDEDGNKLILKLTTNPYNALRIKTANMVAEDLKKMGIEVIKDYPEKIPNELTDEMVEKGWKSFREKIARGNFDIVLLGWELSNIPELSFAFHSSQIKDGSNFINYNNEEMDRLLERAASAPSRKKKKEAYDKLMGELVKDLPYVSLFFKNKALLSSKKIHGEIKPHFNDIYNNIEKWYIPKKYQSKK